MPRLAANVGGCAGGRREAGHGCGHITQVLGGQSREPRSPPAPGPPSSHPARTQGRPILGLGGRLQSPPASTPESWGLPLPTPRGTRLELGRLPAAGTQGSKPDFWASLSFGWLPLSFALRLFKSKSPLVLPEGPARPGRGRGRHGVQTPPSLPHARPRPGSPRSSVGPRGFPGTCGAAPPSRAPGPPPRLPSGSGSRATAAWSSPAATTTAWMRTSRGETTT